MSDDYTRGDNFDYDNVLVDEIERLTAESKAKDVAYETMQEYVTELEERLQALDEEDRDMQMIVKKCFREMNRRLALIEKSERSTTMAHDAKQGRRLLRLLIEDIARELYPDSYENMQTFIRECEETDK